MPIKHSKITDMTLLNKNSKVEMPHDGDLELPKATEGIDCKETTIEINVDEGDDGIYESKKAKRLMTGFCISITYAASIGGTGSLVGTSTNLVLKGYYDLHYPKAGLSFLTYMIFTMPCTVIMMVLAWLWLSYLWLPKKYLLGIFKLFKKGHAKTKGSEIEKTLHDRYNQCGPIR